VPGGTGYLKELLRSPDTLLSMLSQAYEVLVRCECNQDPDKDGCYRCLYAYRESRNLEQTSRDAAVEVLGRILDQKDRLKPIDGLDHVDLNALIESELEQRFIQTLGNVGADVTLTSTLVNGKPGWMLSFAGLAGAGDGPSLAWRIEPQVDLGPADGVPLKTRPDFVVWPLREQAGLLPVAVYLDGLEYHRERVGDDTRKRLGLLASAGFRVWSLNWWDLPEAGVAVDRSGNGDSVEWFKLPGNAGAALRFNQVAKHLRHETFEQLSPLVAEGPFRWLLSYLRGGEAARERLSWLALSRQFSLLNLSTAKDATARAGLAASIEPLVPVTWQHEHIDGDNLLGQQLIDLGHGLCAVASLPLSALRDSKSLCNHAGLLLYLDDAEPWEDSFAAPWRSFWAAVNLFQFLGYCCPVSAGGLARVAYDELLAMARPRPCASVDSTAQDDWAEVNELTAYPTEAGLLAEQGCPVPEIGVDWVGDGDGIIGEVEWLWREQRIAFVDAMPTDELVCHLRESGWKLVSDVEPGQLTQLIDWLGGG
jgi:DEAD/DEAH box helicase domain-containing protein